MPIRDIVIGLDQSWLSRFTSEEVVAAFETGANLWANEVDLNFTVECCEGGGTIRPVFGRIDRAGRVVAWSQLPCPWNPPIAQRYDTSERWALTLNPASGMSLPNVVAHEVGHAIGIGHGPSRNIMHAAIQNDLTDLGPWDREQIHRRYPTRPPQPPEPPDMERLLQCALGVLPQFLSCLFEQEAKAREAGEDSPVEALANTIQKAMAPSDRK